MPVEDFWNNLQRIGGEGSFNVAPKLPPPKPRPVFQPYNGTSNPTAGAGSSSLDKLMRAIKGQESGGDYNATNPSGASGGYQILKNHFGAGGDGWDTQALGRTVSYNEFMGSPNIQDEIARYKLGQYLAKYGAAGAAAAWYGGEGSVSHMYDKKPQNGYPSMYDYWNSVLSKM